MFNFVHDYNTTLIFQMINHENILIKYSDKYSK